MKANKKGISLIVLIITIIVIIILAAAIILSISKNNPITNANKAVSESDFKTAQEAVVLWVGDRWVQDLNGDGIAGEEAGYTYSGKVATNESTLTVYNGDQEYTGYTTAPKVSLSSLGLDSLDEVVIKKNKVSYIKKGSNYYKLNDDGVLEKSTTEPTE